MLGFRASGCRDARLIVRYMKDRAKEEWQRTDDLVNELNRERERRTDAEVQQAKAEVYLQAVKDLQQVGWGPQTAPVPAQTAPGSVQLVNPPWLFSTQEERTFQDFESSCSTSLNTATCIRQFCCRVTR